MFLGLDAQTWGYIAVAIFIVFLGWRVHKSRSSGGGGGSSTGGGTGNRKHHK